MALVLDGTNGVSGVDGTASNPAIEGTDSNTGIFYPAADTVAIGTGGTERVRVVSAGDVGVGTSTPATISNRTVLSINNASNGGALNLLVNGTETLRLLTDNSSFGYVYNIANQPLLFGTNNTERGRFTSGGEFLVGTTSTSFGTQGARMMTTGQIQAVSASGNDAFAGYRQTTTAGDSIITGYSNVGGTQVLKFNAMADGNVRIAAGATYGNISDQKYKTNIVDATPKLQDLMQLQVRNFNVSGSEQKAIGFIAQEFETVFPSLVIESVDKDFEGNDLGTTTKGIKESALIPILVKAIQELNAKVEAQAAEIAALKGNA